MRTPAKPALAALLCGLVLSAYAQHAQRETSPSAEGTTAPVPGRTARRPHRTITSDDGLSVIAAALDPKVRRYAGHDCSHLVHAIYDRAGFPYIYASSDDLYDGVDEFRRVSVPQPGDLVVWHGHVGIVVRPSRHIFFSFMSIGPGIDTYDSKYWISRGDPRFYRYVANDKCTGCSRFPQRARQEKPVPPVQPER